MLFFSAFLNDGRSSSKLSMAITYINLFETNLKILRPNLPISFLKLLPLLRCP